MAVCPAEYLWLQSTFHNSRWFGVSSRSLQFYALALVCCVSLSFLGSRHVVQSMMYVQSFLCIFVYALQKSKAHSRVDCQCILSSPSSIWLFAGSCWTLLTFLVLWQHPSSASHLCYLSPTWADGLSGSWSSGPRVFEILYHVLPHILVSDGLRFFL